MAFNKPKHSVKVPRLYKSAATIAREVKEEGRSLKDLLYNSPRSFFQNNKAIYSLILKTLKNYETLEILLKKSKILKKEERLDPWLARILITEMLWQKKKLPGNSKPVATVRNYEEKFLEILKAVHKPEEEEIEKPIFVRVNTLQTTVKEVIDEFALEGWNLVSTPKKYDEFIQKVMALEEGSFIQDWHIPEILIFPPKSGINEHIFYTSGSIIIQDKASCFVAHALEPPPGSVVLDMCAAPGLKTSHCAAVMRNEGKVYAVEINEKRFKVLNELVEKLHCSCVETIHQDALKLDVDELNAVKYIMIDVPCTGSGIVSRYDYSSKPKEQERVDALHNLQCLLLKRAMKTFPSVEKIIYSTCSLHEEENEGVIEDVLASKASSQFELVACKALEGKNISCGLEKYAFSKKCYRFEPEKHMTNGFFIAMFERRLDIEDDCVMECTNIKVGNEEETKMNELCADSSASNDKKRVKKKRKQAMLNESQELPVTSTENMNLSVQTEDTDYYQVKIKKKKKSSK